MSNIANKVCGVTISGYGSLAVVDGDSSFKESGKKREGVIACNPADTSPVETKTLAELEVSIVVKKTTNLQAIGELEDVLVQVTMGNGKKYYMHNAWVEETPTQGADGKAKMKILSAKSTPAN
jgi:phosphotransferase system IIB component